MKSPALFIAMTFLSITALASEPKTLKCSFSTQSLEGKNEDKEFSEKLLPSEDGTFLSTVKKLTLANGRFQIDAGAVQPVSQPSRIKYDNVSIHLEDTEKDVLVGSGFNTSSVLKVQQNVDMATLNYTTNSSDSGHPFVVVTCVLK